MDKAAFDSEAFAEAMASGETAFAGANYELALEYFQKAVSMKPDDVYALSRAGAAAMGLNRAKEALEVFRKAFEVQESGDNAFNLGNAYFFSGDFNRAAELYAKAEILGCSEKTRAQLYYQLSLMCLLRGDVANALTNFNKFEDCDETKRAATNPKVILEKLKLYLMAKDVERAEEYAVRLIGAQPQNLRPYMVYFNILLTQQKFDEAERVLNEAEKYAVADDTLRLAADLERVTLYIQRASAEPEKAEEHLARAAELTKDRLAKADKSTRQYKQLQLTLGEVLVKQEKFEEAADVLSAVLAEPGAELPTFKADLNPILPEIELTPEECDEALQADMDVMDERIASGEITDEVLSTATVTYGPDGEEEVQFPDGAFGSYDIPSVSAVPEEDAGKKSQLMRADFYERARYLYVSSLLSIDRCEPALPYASALKASKTVMYQFFGSYAEPYILRQLGRDADGKRYAEALAFFRKQMLAKNNSAYAAVFRSRMYAETGKFAAAEEMTKLLPPEQQKSAVSYIADCRNKAASAS